MHDDFKIRINFNTAISSLTNSFISKLGNKDYQKRNKIFIIKMKIELKMYTE